MKTLTYHLLYCFILMLGTIDACNAQYPKHSVDWAVEPNAFLKKNRKKVFSEEEFNVLKEAAILSFSLTFDPDTYRVVDVTYFSKEILLKEKGADVEVTYKVDKDLISKMENIFRENLEIKRVNTLGSVDRENPDCCRFIFHVEF